MIPLPLTLHPGRRVLFPELLQVRLDHAPGIGLARLLHHHPTVRQRAIRHQINPARPGIVGCGPVDGDDLLLRLRVKGLQPFGLFLPKSLLANPRRRSTPVLFAWPSASRATDRPVPVRRWSIAWR